VFDFEDEYKNSVVDYMVSGYVSGITPNPGVMCNREIKFGLFLERALQLGADYIATGHYTRLVNSKISYKLLAAKDTNKDQSYFVWTWTQSQLKYCLFPIGNYTKPQVRALAKKYKLPTAEKPDSQGVCFVGEIDVAKFLKEKLGKTYGPIKTLNNRIVGTHDGAIFYTIGQRKGIGIKGSLPGEQGKIYYVAAKDVDANTLWVAEGKSQKLFSKKLIAKDISWISGKQPNLPLTCLARIRYRQPLQDCIVNSSTNQLKVLFNTPQRAITPGQSAVFYDKTGQMLGGGVIV
ncbi:MAG: tRNA 2-thiouridine(34) synthase MnmA, partial [Candidatus Azambacteria bacterium]|nr:tRNA 2-thiouridine(34) synthase MnmA [Candidatus Azambacteria bacterium]